MSTKIGGFDSSPVPGSTGRTVKRSDPASSSDTAAAGGSLEDTHITGSARTLAALDQYIKDLPAVEQARVDQVLGRLADGSYEINAERIADKLLQAEREMDSLN